MRWLGKLFHATGAAVSLALSLTVGLLLCALFAMYLWLHSESSLAQTLKIAASLLPAGQVLEASEVNGSLQRGGHIGQIRWTHNGFALEARGVDLSWNWRALLNGELEVLSLHAMALLVQDHEAASKTALSELVFPLRVDLPFVLDHLDWDGAARMSLEGLQGHYRFDGTTHHLDNVSLRMAAGTYQVQAVLQAQQPMALSAKLSGKLDAPLSVLRKPLQVQAQASLQGTLSGPDAALEVALELEPQVDKGAPRLGAMRASMQAHVRPSQAQMVDSARGQWAALDLASLWPQAPRTSLSGQAQVVPDGTGWKAQFEVRNALSGALDQQLLPLQSATASVLYRSGQWHVSDVQAALAGGTLQAQGSGAGRAKQWQISAAFKGLQTQKVDTRWVGGAMDGRVTAQQTAKGMVFDTTWSAAAGSRGPALLQALSAQGLWQAPQLQFDKLLVQGRDVNVAGQLRIDTQSFTSSGQLQARVPGAQISLDGKISADEGQGSAGAQISDAATLLQWLQSLPLVGSSVPVSDLRGGVDIALHWTSGWQQHAAKLQIQGEAHAAVMEKQSQHLSDLQIDLSGSLQDLALRLRGQVAVGTQQLELQGAMHASQSAAGAWQVRLDAIQLALNDGQHATPWSAQLQQPVEVLWNAQARTLDVAEGAMRLFGPAPGTGLLLWQAGQWSAPVTPGSAAQWSSKGQLQGVPLAWLELLGQMRLANLGLRGDLLFAARWEASSDASRGLYVKASAQRSSGDLQLLAAEPGGANLAAGLSDAHIDLQISKSDVQVSLLWASEAGGNVQADLQTRLQTINGSSWAVDAPLQGRLRASLPRVGAWSLVAPVGWRMQGTMEADASLSGTRSNPAWRGSLEARDLAIRSVVDGIDVSNGSMKLQLDGQHIEIVEFALQGAGGASGGKLLASGSIDWLPGIPAAPLTARLRIALQATAQGFRVTARADQRLAVSGNLNAQLIDARLSVRGALVADQALFVLPEDTAPKLGSDVVVKHSKNLAAPSAKADAKTAQREAQTVLPDLNITLDPGPNFQLQGHGINTRLAGLLTLKTEGRRLTPLLQGELHTVNGTYRAYGQRLNIDEGTLRFSGAYDNPALDIRALRPNLQQVVGVQISGTAQVPVMRLYSDPDLPDADKLSWLMLGQASSNGGAQTAMLQQAALALLSGKGGAPTEALFSALGLDEVTLGQTAITNVDGSTGTEATVKLGKRISHDFYVAYERSLAGTLGTFYVFYDLSRRFTLRGQSGVQNALDLIFTTRYD